MYSETTGTDCLTNSEGQTVNLVICKSINNKAYLGRPIISHHAYFFAKQFIVPRTSTFAKL